MNSFRFSLRILPALLCVCFLLSAQADSESDAIAEIRTKYNEIEAMEVSDRTIQFEADEEPAAGTLTKFFHDGELVKATLSYSLGDHGGADEIFYYHRGVLFFAFVTEFSWRFTGKTQPNGESETSDTATEHRLYFAEGKLIRHLRKEAVSTDPSLLTQLLNKAENAPHADPQLVSEIYQRGLKVPLAEGPPAVARIIVGE